MKTALSNDTQTIKYKILLYLYARYEEKIAFSEVSYAKTIGKDDINDLHLARIYNSMQEDGLIENAVFVNPWGKELIFVSEEADLRITSKGIDYLRENDAMKRIGGAVFKAAGLAASLLPIVGLMP